jgi:hypothetical protein
MYLLMAIVSLFNVITQDMWPANLLIPSMCLRGRVVLAAKLTDQLTVDVGRRAIIIENGKES